MDKLTKDNIKQATMSQLDEIIEQTEYAETGVACGPAAYDQDLRRAAQNELGRRMFGEDAQS